MAPRPRRSSKRGALKKAHRRRAAGPSKPPPDLASRLRGLYSRVASRTGVHPSYVSRVARGERHSSLVSNALRRELNKIIRLASK
jgi:hypothetical protein